MPISIALKAGLVYSGVFIVLRSVKLYKSNI